jgi:UDPglucose--hexose-1-phosphate uridylyltransferase
MAPSHTPETRRDRITQRWVACAPDRSSRPQKTGDRPPDETPPSDTPVEGCPFCPGHEDQLPAVLWELAADDGRPWRTRAVPNKYPALTSSPAPDAGHSGLYQTRESRGRQEVLIDTPSHHRGLARMPAAQVDAVLRTYLVRYRALRADDLYPFVFRNHGAGAGASIPHPHSQIIGTNFAPPRIEREEAAAQRRHEETGRCPYCEMIETELDAGARLVSTTDAFVAFVPFAAPVPYEVWILPRHHEPEFARLSGADRSVLAGMLRRVARRLHTRVGDPDYNLFVRTALEHGSEAPHLHWSLRLRPRTTVEAGFERSTGVQINPSIPERDAAVLRGDALDGDSQPPRG